MRLSVLTAREQIYEGVELWNRKYPDYFIRDKLVEQNIFAPYDKVKSVAYGVFERETMIGFTLFKYLTEHINIENDNDLGWISLLTGSRKDVLELLIDEIENEMVGLKINRIRFGGDPQPFLPGLPVDLDDQLRFLLLEKDFKIMSYDYDLYRDIKKFTPPERIKGLLNQTELKAGRVKLQDEPVLIDFLLEHFPGRWRYEAENINRLPGGAIDYWLLYKNQKPVAFARSNSADSVYQGTNVNWGPRFGKDYCGLGPIGVAESERGNGYGLLLISKIIADFRQWGYTTMIIDWTSLLDYYRRLGFSPFIKYGMFFKDLH